MISLEQQGALRALTEIRRTGNGTQMNEYSLEHIDFVASERLPMEMLSRYLAKWALECVRRVQEGDADFEGIDMWAGFKTWGRV